jgi:hypothetical protein
LLGCGVSDTLGQVVGALHFVKLAKIDRSSNNANRDQHYIGATSNNFSEAGLLELAPQEYSKGACLALSFVLELVTVAVGHLLLFSILYR